ncbi:MAG: DNA-binding transcriptional regulator [Planctomycetota bacterium]|nr:DNA-binding transcriptional regulator [Planctomycetota bacterium]
MLELPRVALLIQSSLEYGRGLLRGIGSYQQAHGPWTVFHRIGMLPESLPPQLRKWRPQGIIGQFETRQVLRQVQRLRLPTVDLFGLHAFRNIARFGVDHAAISRMVADYFLELGYQHFAYCGFQGVYYSQRRGKAFVDYLAEHGHAVDVFDSSKADQGSGVFEIESAGQFDIERIGRWLQTMPRPLALMAGTDVRARQVLEACRLFECRVPDEVAVLGVGNDEVLCNLSAPPLTSVALRPERIGYEAAALLDQLMRGETAPTEPLLHGPLCIVSRQSTNSLGMHDPVLRRAVLFFQEHFAEGISVADVSRHVGVSRSTLQRRFVGILGRTPREELIRIQLERVKELLRDTTLPLAKIAARTGFDYPECLMRLFKRKIGKTPTQYRDQFAGEK